MSERKEIRFLWVEYSIQDKLWYAFETESFLSDFFDIIAMYYANPKNKWNINIYQFMEIYTKLVNKKILEIDELFLIRRILNNSIAVKFALININYENIKREILEIEWDNSHIFIDWLEEVFNDDKILIRYFFEYIELMIARNRIKYFKNHIANNVKETLEWEIITIWKNWKSTEKWYIWRKFNVFKIWFNYYLQINSSKKIIKVKKIESYSFIDNSNKLRNVFIFEIISDFSTIWNKWEYIVTCLDEWIIYRNSNELSFDDNNTNIMEEIIWIYFTNISDWKKIYISLKIDQFWWQY